MNRKTVFLCLLVFSFAFGAYEIRKIMIASPSAQTYPKVSFVTGSRREPASAGASHGHARRAATVLYALKSNATPEQLNAFQQVISSIDLQDSRKMAAGHIHMGHAKNPQGRTEDELATMLNETGAVEFAETDDLVDLSYTPNDPSVASQWHHTKINSYAAWDVTTGNLSSVIVADCDTGVEVTHPDLAAHLISPGYNSVDGTANIAPTSPHGTMTSGAMAAIIGNGVGVSGVAGNVKILPIKVSNLSDGSAYFSDLVTCIDYAADHGANVVNMSYDASNSSAIDSAAQYLRSKRGLLFVAAGNSGVDLSANPDYSSFEIIGATDQNDALASWSNYGTPVDMVAPGVDILTTTTGGSYAYASGTSFAAPLASGVAALVYSVNPAFSASQVEQILFSSARVLGTGPDDRFFGHGLIDANAAVTAAKAALASPTPTATPTATPTPTPTPTPKPTPGKKKK